MTQANGRLDIIANAFRPGAEIDEPSRFAGRSPEVTKLTKALHQDGSCPIIYGDRGLGKSSLAVQLQRIAMGDLDLLDRQGIGQWGFPGDEAFIAFYVECSDQTRTAAAVLDRAARSMASVSVVDDGSTASRLIDRETRTKISLKLFESEEIRRYASACKSLSDLDLSSEERIAALAAELTQVTGHRILVILDELDRVEDTRGLASFLKNASSSDLKFVLVGIAQNISALIADHQSVERISLPVEVSRMSEAELVAIVDRAMDRLEHLEVEFTFGGQAARRLAKVAGGFPWFVHALGQSAVLMAESEGLTAVGINHVRRALDDLTNNQFAQQFADMYQMAVRDSPHRERVLRSFALWSDQDVPTADVYRVLKSKLGVKNPSVYKRDLMQQKHGRVLVTPPYQPRGLVRFLNEMFKVYVRIRPSLYTGMDNEVNTAWNHRPSA